MSEAREDVEAKPMLAGEPYIIDPDDPRPDVVALWASVSRFCNAFWNRDGERPRIGIPARPDYDDDLTLVAGIRKLADERDALAAEVARLRGQPSQPATCIHGHPLADDCAACDDFLGATP